VSYNPELLVFREKSHRYYYDGVHVPGVTTILNTISKGDALTHWAVAQTIDYLEPRLIGELTDEQIHTLCDEARVAHKVVKEAAASIGTLAHDWIERYLKGEEPTLPENPKARNSCEAAVKWLAEHGWETLAIEEIVYSPTHLYAGKLDWLARVDGVLAVPDWKTSKAHYSTHRYQTAAYVKALEEVRDIHIPDRWILRIDKETGEHDPLHLTRDDLEADFEAFLAALTIYRREAQLRRKRC
jgi:genome maintenance exonuclease 1